MSPNDLDPILNTWRSRRNLNFFILALLGFLVLVIIGAMIHEAGLDEYLLPALPGLGIVVVVWVVQSIRRARARRRERLRPSPLSRDELRVARSKLMQYRKARNL